MLPKWWKRPLRLKPSEQGRDHKRCKVDTRRRQVGNYVCHGVGPRYSTVTIEYSNLKRDLCPFEQHFTAALNERPRKVTNSGKNGFLIEVSSKEQRVITVQIDNVCGMKRIAKEHSFLMKNRLMIYV